MTLHGQSDSRPSWRERHPALTFALVLAACIAFPFAYNGLLAVFH